MTRSQDVTLFPRVPRGTTAKMRTHWSAPLEAVSQATSGPVVAQPLRKWNSLSQPSEKQNDAQLDDGASIF